MLSLALVFCIGLVISEVRGRRPVCFDKIGCFETGMPWSYLLRPVPPPQGPNENPATIYFFTRENLLKPNVITTYPDINMDDAQIDGKRPTVVIVHGHGESAKYEWMHTLKDVYLDRLDANVLLTDWEPGASKFYPQSVSNIRVVARLISRLLKYLMESYGVKSSQIHLIGHSLGADVVSYIGKETPGIGRLTALDPAQPLYEGYGRRVNLDKSDAQFVEVVHTNAKLFVLAFGRGSITPLGHIDFYFNGGRQQPGCVVPENLPNITSPMDVFLFKYHYDNYTGLCSHEKARLYLIEAYNRTTDCVFMGHRAAHPNGTWSISGSFWNFLKTYFLRASWTDAVPCGIDECVPFGLDTIQSPLRGVFAVRTNIDSPYCMADHSASIREKSSGEDHTHDN